MPAGPTVAVLAYDGMSVFETGIVTEVIGLSRPEFDLPWYELTICAARPGPLRVIGGATLHTPHGLETLGSAATVIVPGVADVTAEPDPAVSAALRRAHGRVARVVSICSGAFALRPVQGIGPVERRRCALFAAAVGFATTVTYRHHFQRANRPSPSAYRRSFRTAGRSAGESAERA